MEGEEGGELRFCGMRDPSLVGKEQGGKMGTQSHAKVRKSKEEYGSGRVAFKRMSSARTRTLDPPNRLQRSDATMPEHRRLSGAQRKCGFAEKETTDVEQSSSSAHEGASSLPQLGVLFHCHLLESHSRNAS